RQEGGHEVVPRAVDTPEWKAVANHFDQLEDVHLRDLFAEDSSRGERFTVEAGDLFLDYSKNRIRAETIELLLALADVSGLRERIDGMFRGEPLNVTEDRAVLHVALRMPRDARLVVDGQDVVAGVHAVLDKMSDFSERVRSGEWTGF